MSLILVPEPASTLLTLAVPGTQETQQMDVEAVRDAVARGEIGLDNWVWSADLNEWVPLAQLPEFAEPTPTDFVSTDDLHPVPVEPTQPGAVITAAQPLEDNDTAAQPAAVTHAPTLFTTSLDDHPHEFPVLRIGFFALTALIIALVVVNYVLVEKPFRASLAKTPFAAVSAHAHLGAFVQPGALLIHVFPSKTINQDNFADLLGTLTQSAPRSALPGLNFQTVSLTSGWLSQYTIGAADWDGLAEMSSFSPDDKREFVLTHLEGGNGVPLLVEHRNESMEERKTREDAIWKQLVSNFHGS